MLKNVNHIRILILLPFLALLALASCGGETPGGGSGADTQRPTPGTGIVFSGITHNAFTLFWGEAKDNVSSSENLQYRVVRADSYTKLNLVSRALSITGEGVVLDWSPHVVSVDVADLDDDTQYWINVIVKDEAGNMDVYAPSGVRTLENEAPVPGTDITFTGTTENSTTVNWGAAADNIYPRDQLEYKVVRSTVYSAVDTVSDANGTGPDLVMDWTYGNLIFENLTAPATGLDDGVSYYFAVLVKNPDQKIALYDPKVVITTDVSAPEVKDDEGNPLEMIISFPLTDANSIKLSWLKSEDQLSLQKNLQYKVVRSETDLGSDPDTWDAVTGDGVVTPWTNNIDTSTAESLIDNFTYYFAVLVQDEAGNKNIYGPASETTLDGTAPITAGLVVNFSDVDYNSLKVIWAEASDGVSSPANLEYRLVKFTDADPLTAQEAETTTDPDHYVCGWSTYETLFGVSGDVPYEVTSLDDGVKYNFWIFVRDEELNVAHYELTDETTLDNTPPTLPADPTLIFTEVKSTSAKVNWNKATDNLDAQGDLEYKVMRAASDLGTDPSDWLSTGVQVLDWTPDTDSETAESLTVDNTYYFAVIVRDKAENMSLYTVGHTTTKKTWEVVGTVGFAEIPDVNAFVSLAIGSDDKPYVAYQDAGNGDRVTVKYFNGSAWTALGTAGFSSDTASLVNLKFLGTTPYVSFRNSETNGYKATVMKYIGTSWVAVPTDSTGMSDTSVYTTDMNIYDANPYVAYYDDSGTDRLATVRKYNGTSWEDVGDTDFSLGTALEISIAAIKAETIEVCEPDGGGGKTCVDEIHGIPYVVFQDYQLDVGPPVLLTQKAMMMKLTRDNDDYKWIWDIAPNSDGFTGGNASLISTGVDFEGDILAAYMDGANGNRVTVREFSSGIWSNVGMPGFTTKGVNCLSMAIHNTGSSSTTTVAFGDKNAGGRASVMEYTTAWDYVGGSGFSSASILHIALSIDSNGKQYVAFTNDQYEGEIVKRVITVMEYK